MKAIIIDDELMAIELMEIMLKDFDRVELVGSFTSPKKALDALASLDVNVVFLDIEMGDVSGIEFAEKLLSIKEDLEIVFVTAYSKYAIDAFELNVVDYLLKPIGNKRLAKTIERLIEKIESDRKDETGIKENKNLIVKSFGSFEAYDGSGNLAKWRTQKAKELLAYLWYNENNPVKKSVILDEVFMDKDLDKATTLLHTTIYQLRKYLRSLGYKNPILYANDSYLLKINIDSDISRFEELIKKPDISPAEITELLDLYRDGFLSYEGYHWSMAKEKHIQDSFVIFLVQCSTKRASEGKYDVLLKRCLDKLYGIDPFNEKTIELLLRYHASVGGSAQVNSFYSEHKRTCKRDLDVEPVESLQRLFRELTEDSRL